VAFDTLNDESTQFGIAYIDLPKDSGKKNRTTNELRTPMMEKTPYEGSMRACKRNGVVVRIGRFCGAASLARAEVA